MRNLLKNISIHSKGMQNGIKREVREAFRSGELSLHSGFDSVPHIGPYLSQRLQQFFHANTLHGFRNRIRHKTAREVSVTLQAALQNARSDSCHNDQHAGDIVIHDFNWPGYGAMLYVVVLLSSGLRRTGGLAGPNNPWILAPFNFTHLTHNSVHLRRPARGVSRLECLDEGACNNHPDGQWDGNKCHRNLRMFQHRWPEFSPALHDEVRTRARNQAPGPRQHAVNFGRITPAEFAIVRPHVV